jgi:peptidoglycan/LPS O-acetylase OafA/YrhL
LRQSMSIYLDALRLFAAIGVFLFHSGAFIAPWLSGVLRSQGFECVAVFFVLSGFVIRFASVEKEHDWRQYLGARAMRLYSVAGLAIVLTLVVDAIGIRINPKFYEHTSQFNSTTSAGDILSYLTFTNELWFRHAVVGSNEPYWSLGFEAAYYLFFAAAIYASGWRRALLLLVWAVIAGPKIIATLPLWLMGVGTYELLRSPNIQLKRPVYMGLGLVVGSVALYVLNRYSHWHQGVGTIFNPASMNDLMLAALYMTITGGAVAINIIGFHLIASKGFQWPQFIGKAIKWLAGGSFTLYLMHEPLLALARAAFPNIAGRPLLGAGVLIAILAAILLLAEFGERRKRLFRRLLDLGRDHHIIAAADSAGQ